MKLKILSSVLVVLFQYSFSQSIQLSQDATISVLTFGPGQSLNDAFGHNAFRITDTTRGIDLVYGYGEYDFEAPFFYLKFAQGKLNYLLSRHRFNDIYRYYSQNNRTIKEQILNLSTNDQQKLFNYLENNYKPENRRYKYDFFYDNCATRIRDVAEGSISKDIIYNVSDTFVPKTFRTLIYEHVDKNSWGGLGIDLALGSIIDQEATAREHMFLPKYIHRSFANATLDSEKTLVKSESKLFQAKEIKDHRVFLFSPLVILSLLAFLILYTTYKDYKNRLRSQWLDVSIASFTGFIGIILTLLWFATDHTTTGYNYNLLWAFPFNFILLRQLKKSQPKPWVKGYFKFLLVMLCLLTLHWLIGVQVFAITLIPLIVALAIRYIYFLRTL
ncbi:DUF4105 domain-containing protein [Winogradskyella sp. DF17]|uniref:DUF4105 domain-containing protein n=1 Tax=Winogradskyella pelagia TaxID=2819984 RepID=A0ABS3T1Q0_9FLAO|nr:DUF4105 domain-containing protein [Winogradskyella sp. DF17]MBO3116676.1 DUF4105 domain-containing protein [Winogradskyella sp. DF17]